MTLGSIRIIEDASLVVTHEDWSKVRSPSRAERRRRQGHRQNIVMKGVPSCHVYFTDDGRTMIMHPSMAREMRMISCRMTERRGE